MDAVTVALLVKLLLIAVSIRLLSASMGNLAGTIQIIRALRR